MEASALELRHGTAQTQGILSGSLLRLRSDEQLVDMFRAGSDDAFCAIHDRYRKRLEAYAGQMLNGSGQDAEDALQDVFERAYFGLRADDRHMALRAWLYRVAHNRCLDQLRRPALAATVEPDEAESRQLDPAALAEQRESLRRLIVDISRLPDQQRSALLLREMSGMSYAELAGALAVSVPAVKSLLVRARIGLAAAGEARDTACSVIREELVIAHDRRARPGANVRRHLRDCPQCRHFRRSMRSLSRNLAAVTPVLGPVGVLVKLLGGGGGAAGGLSGSGGGAALGGSAMASGGGLVAASGAVGTAGVVTGGLTAGTMSHVAAIVAAALMTAGGAVAVQSGGTAVPVHHMVNRVAPVAARPWTPPPARSDTVPVTGGAAVAPPPATKLPRERATPVPKTRRPAGSSTTSAVSDPAASTAGADSPGTGSVTSSATSSAGSTSSTAATSASTSTAGLSSVPGSGEGTGTSGQTSDGTTPATSGSGTGSPDSTGGSTSDS